MSYADALAGLNAIHRFWRADAMSGSEVFGRYLAGDILPAGSLLPQVLQDQAGAMTMQRLTSLNQSAVYYVHPEIGDLLMEAADTLPGTILAPEYVHTTHGFVWFVDPMVFHDPPGVRALHWQTVPRETSPLWQRDGLAISSYAPGPEPQFSNWAIWEYEDTLLGGIEVNWPLHVLLTLWLFLQQQVLTSRTEQITNRSARRRIQASGHDPEVQVVQMRRPATDSVPSDAPHPVNWSHQWLVRGHWRNQWLPSQDRHEPRWILPYIKGPEDKPLRVRRRVFNVRR